MRIEQLRKLMNPLRTRIGNMVLSGQVKLVNDGSKLQQLQVSLLNGMVRDKVSRLQNYGFTSHPLKDAQAVFIAPDGDTGAGLIIAVDDRRYRLKLEEGEVALYDHKGNWVKIKQGDIVEAKAATKVIAETPLFECSFDCKVGGNLEVVGSSKLTGPVNAVDSIESPSVLANGKELSGHNHNDPVSGVTGNNN